MNKKIPADAKLFKVEIVSEVYVMAPDSKSAEQVAGEYEVKRNLSIEEPIEINVIEIKPEKDLEVDPTMKGCYLYFDHRYEGEEYGYDDMIEELRIRNEFNERAKLNNDK